MKKRIPLAIAAVLTACGAVATTSNDSAESAPQKSAKAKHQPRVGFERFDKGGMAGCFDPKLSGYARAAAERIGGVPCKQEARSTPAAAKGADPFAGRWSADFDGGGGNVTIIRRSPTESSYWIEMDVANEQGCAGELSGEGTARSNRLTLRVPVPDDSNQCVVDFTRQGGRLSIKADYCHHFSGMSCGFTGTASFTDATETLEPPMD